jgi:hypothetical protein
LIYDRSLVVSDETKKKISQALTGKKRPKISEALKKYYNEHEVWNKGIAHSEATKERISISCGVGTWNRRNNDITQTPINIDIGSRSEGIAYNPDNEMMYVAALDVPGHGVIIIDTDTSPPSIFDTVSPLSHEELDDHPSQQHLRCKQFEHLLPCVYGVLDWKT